MKAKKSLGLKTFKFARAKRALGQNFLKSEIALRKMIEAGEIKKDDVILEIGPGKGKLTEKLLENAGQVIAVEKDRELFEFLENKFEKEIKINTLILVCGDILNFNINNYNLAPRTYKLISNIPYNITGAILKKFLGGLNQPKSMVLMVQHEVAKRIMGRSGKAKPHEIKPSGVARSAKSGFRESILSISVKAYGEPKIIMKVEARYFSPKPKVDSAIIAIKNISRKLFTSPQPSPYKGEGVKLDEERFWQIVKAGFAHKRKKLSSNLKRLKNGRINDINK